MPSSAHPFRLSKIDKGWKKHSEAMEMWRRGKTRRTAQALEVTDEMERLSGRGEEGEGCEGEGEEEIWGGYGEVVSKTRGGI
eukprot:750017-Hanusia_phi.AAC.3